MKTILITGGTGFIGRPTVEILAQQTTYELYLLTRKTYTDHGRIHYMKGSIQDEALLQAFFAEHHPETLLHLAWNVKAEAYASSAENQEWIAWSQKLVERFLQNGGHTIIGAGTCFEYDLTGCQTLYENSPCRPATFYGKCKLETYRRIKTLAQNYQARFVWGRIFYPYGRGEEKRKLFSHVIETLKNRQNFLVKTPEDIVDYIHVKDVARLFAAFIENPDLHGVQNVCTGKGTKIKTILQMIAEAMQAENSIVWQQNPAAKTIVGHLNECLRPLLHYDLPTGIQAMLKERGET